MAPPEPELKEVRTKDGAGRIITTFEGEHPSVWMRQFSATSKARHLHKDQIAMSDAFEDTMLYRRYKAQPAIPDKFADSTEATIAFDEVLTPLGLRAPMRGPNESEADHLAKLGEYAARLRS